MLESGMPARSKRTILFALIAFFILLIAFGSYFLYRRFYAPKLISPVQNQNDFAPYVEDADWYAFGCTISELVEKKVNFKTVYSLTMAKCEYKRPDGKDDYVWVPLAVINPQTDQLMIYGDFPTDDASSLTHFWVTDILRQRGTIANSQIYVGLNMPTEKNALVFGQNFVANDVSEYHSANQLNNFVKTGDSKQLGKDRVILPIGIMYTNRQ